MVVAMEDSLCEWLWTLLEGETFCNKFGAGVLGNQIQPPRDGMRLVLSIRCLGSMFTRAYAYESPVLQKRHSTQNWSSLERVVQMPPAPWAQDFVPGNAPRKLQNFKFLQLKGSAGETCVTDPRTNYAIKYATARGHLSGANVMWIFIIWLISIRRDMTFSKLHVGDVGVNKLAWCLEIVKLGAGLGCRTELVIDFAWWMCWWSSWCDAPNTMSLYAWLLPIDWSNKTQHLGATYKQPKDTEQNKTQTPTSKSKCQQQTKQTTNTNVTDKQRHIHTGHNKTHQEVTNKTPPPPPKTTINQKQPTNNRHHQHNPPSPHRQTDRQIDR